jgi:hypothetical protein
MIGTDRKSGEVFLPREPLEGADKEVRIPFSISSGNLEKNPASALFYEDTITLYEEKIPALPE